MVITVAPGEPAKPEPWDAKFKEFFGPPGLPSTQITVRTPSGKTLVNLVHWSMWPYSSPDRRSSDPRFYRVEARFVSPANEHYYGLGENQEGFLDHRNHVVNCWHNYDAPGGESVCIPFLVSSLGYGLIWDNPSKTTIVPGFEEETQWSSEVGQRVSFFVIAGATTDEIYLGYRQLTGPTHLLPKSAYGFIQSKLRYGSQSDVLSVARGYRERHLPADVMVVDFLYYTKMGQMDMEPDQWPDPAAMNRQLHAMDFSSMISVWPQFVPGSRFYQQLADNGWLIHHADGTPVSFGYQKGSNIDTTNPAAAHWFWNTIRDNLAAKGFDAYWLDETEPDNPPNGAYFYIGPGTQYFNVYPLFHTAAVYNGMRDDLHRRALILARAAYLGSQRNGTITWSSDIYSTWDVLKRQVPAGLDFTASGNAYWCADTGGFQPMPAIHHPVHPPLIDPSDARDNVGQNDDYPELFVRWFEYATFEPIFRVHGMRPNNEVWSYGKQAEPILEKYLRLRYQMMPFIYSLAYHTYKTGSPYMRALFMDFPNDPNVADLGDEYMFGPALLVAPVTDQGSTSRTVYLPSGTDWYDYWTNKRFHGGQTIRADAPIDTIPLFVRAGSILPLGVPVESASQPQKLAKILVYPGADGSFTLYQDDGKTYDYEKGDSRITEMHWNNAAGRLIHSGATAWSGPDSGVVEVVGR